MGIVVVRSPRCLRGLLRKPVWPEVILGPQGGTESFSEGWHICPCLYI